LDQRVRLQGHITAEQVRRDPYVYLPFDVPIGTRRVHVSYSYSQPATAPFGMGPGNTLDIGIFDSRGHDFLTAPGFRGWSGSARNEFFIGPAGATPGYISGPLFPGEWNLLLGTARGEPEGITYDVTVTLATDAPADDRTLAGMAPGESPRSPTEPASSNGKRWLKGDLHTHTEHSDGANSIEEIVRNAIEKGLDFLAVTDHNTTTHHAELDRLSYLPIVLIPGEEVTTYWGHANTWGLREWIDFRCADEASIASVRDYIHRRGAILSINHPKSTGPPWLFHGWEGYQAMEVWQAPWRFHNWDALQRWDGLLNRSERVVAVGGSDTHSIPPAAPRHPHGIGNPTTWVYAEENERSILDAISAGHVFISDAPEGPELVLRADPNTNGAYETLPGDTITASGGERLRFRVDVYGGNDRKLWIVSDGRTFDIIPLTGVESIFTFTLQPASRRYVRAELRGFRGRPERGEVIWAMTNPIWLDERRRKKEDGE
jgi:hypothetical protein